MRSGYSPKTYDGFFLEWEQSTLVQLLQGGHIAADAHFTIGKELFRNSKFYVTGGKHRDPDTSNDDEALSSTTKVQEKRNIFRKLEYKRTTQSMQTLQNWG
ncbi:hypothetical protein PROFUN_15341 [Planoprotostelium fungivorum]|uniref:Uncharacterized protein n=1 Tax=Planoprotostelium fungivorum TaxID=1890364 RepID=A0A2P6MWT3_9EUKA|nr:hypothetical protein PROFUN_15341 [Planoprotostelium fungivorum]